ncbi:MAG: hypothetical protein BWX66_01360 [Deltaproteobacteria bacterium ADurb.Bin058]|nr:MAG: hypothetical protein BWX66_01360 [Deltaproteobacteria bacterium ADurb.Bin058]
MGPSSEPGIQDRMPLMALSSSAQPFSSPSLAKTKSAQGREFICFAANLHPSSSLLATSSKTLAKTSGSLMLAFKTPAKAFALRGSRSLVESNKVSAASQSSPCPVAIWAIAFDTVSRCWACAFMEERLKIKTMGNSLIAWAIYFSLFRWQNQLLLPWVQNRRLARPWSRAKVATLYHGNPDINQPVGMKR